jgi:hypothetical protein
LRVEPGIRTRFEVERVVRPVRFDGQLRQYVRDEVVLLVAVRGEDVVVVRLVDPEPRINQEGAGANAERLEFGSSACRNGFSVRRSLGQWSGKLLSQGSIRCGGRDRKSNATCPETCCLHLGYPQADRSPGPCDCSQRNTHHGQLGVNLVLVWMSRCNDHETRRLAATATTASAEGHYGRYFAGSASIAVGRRVGQTSRWAAGSAHFLRAAGCRHQLGRNPLSPFVAVTLQQQFGHRCKPGLTPFGGASAADRASDTRALRIGMLHVPCA